MLFIFGFSAFSCVEWLNCPCVRPRSKLVAVGIIFSSARPLWLIRFEGMTLSGKQPGPPVVTLHARPLFGSLMKILWPVEFTDCEKSPRSSAAVGIVQLRSGPGRL